MKCPSCSEPFSDLRDICPSCLLDVRGHKQQQGKKITHPQLSYAELLQKLEKKAYLQKINLSHYLKRSFTESPLAQANYEDEVLSLFEGLYHQLKAEGERSFVLTADQMQKKANPEEVALLFDLLTESVEDPDKAARYIEDIARTEQTTVHAPELQSELQSYEKLFEAPLYSLKGSGVKKEDDVSAALVVEDVGGESLGFFFRITAILLDALIVFAITVGGAITAYPARAGEMGVSVGEFVLAHADAMMLAAGLLLPVSIGYLLLTSLALHGSLGTYLLGGAIVDERGNTPTYPQLIVRSLLAPLSFILFGFLSIFTRKPALHERISATELRPAS